MSNLSRFDKCLFIRYPKKTRDYYFYHVEEQKMFISNRAIFLEKKFFNEEIVASKVELEEV